MGITVTGGIKVPQGKFSVGPSTSGVTTDPDFASVSLLLHFDGSNGSTTFTDSSTFGHTSTVFAQAQLSTTDAKFGTACGLFDGNDDYIQMPQSSAFVLGGGAFTVEFWIKTSVTTNMGLMGNWSGTTPGSNWVIQKISRHIRFVVGNNVIVGLGTSNIDDDVYHHIAIVRDDGIVDAFVDGTSEFSNGNAASLGSSTTPQMTVGNYPFAINLDTLWFDGRYDDLRVTPGVARYTSNFSVPTEAFPDS